MTQLDMFGGKTAPAPRPTAKPRTAKRASISERWEAFRRANPHVMHEMLRLARARLERGERRIAVKALWEELRASLDLIAEGGLGPLDGKYKLDNSFTALAARRLIELEPSLRTVIEIRKRKAK